MVSVLAELELESLLEVDLGSMQHLRWNVFDIS